jgi:hypothetical protein
MTHQNHDNNYVQKILDPLINLKYFCNFNEKRILLNGFRYFNNIGQFI